MEYNKKKFSNNSKLFIILFQIVLLFNIIKTQTNECSKQTPFLISDECKNSCTKEEYDSKVCILNNNIIKSQNLTNIIYLGDFKFRYVNFASYSNGDMVLETTSYPELNKRIFYGLSQNGWPFFKSEINGEETETPFYFKTIYNESKFESENSVIMHSTNGNEYYLSLSKLECYTELFDFKNDEFFSKPTTQFSSYVIVNSLRHSFFPLSTKNTGKLDFAPVLFCWKL